ncbi:hypothetical protein GDO81_000196 [Engystomops pustulosus]|uniref:Secreted protein n=1 Tax=Engystomops pustulosus TaxID=76066 RepID=A0AAV7D234_ENGPU|nr:hypothetical protein GDO81_000196 [Engystomops pustulosus]
MKLETFALLTVATLLISHTFLVEGNKQREGKKTNKEEQVRREAKIPFSYGEKRERIERRERLTSRQILYKGDIKLTCVFGGNPAHVQTMQQIQIILEANHSSSEREKPLSGPKAVLKSKECRKGPAEAHLRYHPHQCSGTHHEHKSKRTKPTTKVNIAEPTTDCVRTQMFLRRRVAKDYCGDSGGSLCLIFFSMVQGSPAKSKNNCFC